MFSDLDCVVVVVIVCLCVCVCVVIDTGSWRKVFFFACETCICITVSAAV